MEAPAQAGAEAQAAGPAGRPQARPPVPPEGLVELPASFRELFTFFCENATMHGAIRLVCSSGNRLKTAAWGLLFLGALGLLYWQFGLLFEQYWGYPVIMTVSLRLEPKLFPSVTLCDMNPVRPRPARRPLQALDAFAQENILALYKFNVSASGAAPVADAPGPAPAWHLDRTIRLQRLGGPGGRSAVGFRLCNRTGGDCFYRAYSSGVKAVREWYRFHYVSILALLPADPADSPPRGHGGPWVFPCRYHGQACQAGSFQAFHHPTYGSCYTFGNVTHGISLVFRAGQQDHFPLLTTEAGIKVLVHKRHHSPFLEQPGFNVRPGTETTISIREDEVHRLGSPYGRCTDGAEGLDVPLPKNTLYTMRACLVSCFQQLMVKTCSCSYYLYPQPPGAEPCSSAKHPAWGHCFYRLYRDLETHRLPCASRCPPPCRESSYKLSAGTSKWPSSTSADWILAVLGQQGRRSRSGSLSPRSNVAKVNIFYQELNHRTVDETPVYSVPQLLSAMGSLWSLWFGSSVLSVLELLELFLDAVALSLLLGCRWLRRTQGSPPGGGGSPPPGQRPARCPATAGTSSDARGPSWRGFQGLWPGSRLKSEAKWGSPNTPVP